jgi:hypothetical protein
MVSVDWATGKRGGKYRRGIIVESYLEEELAYRKE